MSIELKIKSKHLGKEAQIIRFEERKLKKQAKWLREHQKDDTVVMQDWFSLNDHRRTDVRYENRATFLARAYIKGKPYNTVESKRHNEWVFQCKITPRIVAMVNKYSNNRVDGSTILAWANLD